MTTRLWKGNLFLSSALIVALFGVASMGPAAASGSAQTRQSVALPRAALRQYVGDYQLAPGARFSITLRGNRLYAQLTGQSAYPIYASARDEFFYRIVNARISFKRDKRGRVDALVLHQHGMDMPAPRTGSTVTKARKAFAKRIDAERRCFTERPVRAKTPAGKLFGLLTIPRGARAVPAILLIPGSGPVDLNGDGPGLSDLIYQQLAYALGCNGYAVLRYDKRGLGRSTGNGNDVTIDDYRSDVLALARKLAHEPGIAPGGLILMGHSEGGLIAPYTAPKLGAKLRAVVLLEAPGMPLAQVLLNQTRREARARGASKAKLAELNAHVQALIRAIRSSHGPQMTVPANLKDFRLARAFAPAAGLLRSEMDLDPVRLVARLKVPTLIVQGGADVQVGIQNAKRLHAANTRTTLVQIPHMTHDLVVAHGKPIDFAEPPPDAPIDPALVKRVVHWLEKAAQPEKLQRSAG